MEAMAHHDADAKAVPPEDRIDHARAGGNKPMTGSGFPGSWSAPAKVPAFETRRRRSLLRARYAHPRGYSSSRT